MAIRDWSAQELASVRPLDMADRLGIDEPSMIDACLIAAKEGVLNLRWEVLCPTCRIAADSREQLSQIGSHTHCEACDVDFQSNLAGAIEMVFQTHCETREVNTQRYCIGGQVHAPHVVAQVRVDPGERMKLPLDLAAGDYLLRGNRLPRTQLIRVQTQAAPSTIEFKLATLGSGNHTPKLSTGRQSVTLDNDLGTMQILRIERTIQRNNVVTAAMASTNPLFRQLFPHQTFASDNPIATELMTFPATSINNVDDLYTEMGDTAAYATIHRHHEMLAECVASAGGTVAKTIGEKMLASFIRRENAVVAAARIRQRMAELADLTISLGIGIHCGPTLITTQNNRLDYFGGTVLAVSALPGLAGGDTLVTEMIYSDPSVADTSIHSADLIERMDLPGCPRTRVERIRTVEKQ